MDSQTCGKGCMVGCIVVVVLVILLGAGCYIILRPAINMGMDVVKISTYFEELRADGWEVDDSDSNQPEGYGFNFEDNEPMVWRARETADDDWIYYVWEVRFGEEGRRVPTGLQDIRNLSMLPRTEEALEVHEELGLALPDGFELEDPWEPPEDTDRGRDRTRDRDRTDDQDDEEPVDEEEDGNGTPGSRDRERPRTK